MRPLAAVTTVVLALLAAFAPAAPRTGAPPPTVPYVDLDRYLGSWYEIAHIPNRFQRHCAANTSAHYARRADGLIEVVNRCETKEGKIDEAHGIARVVDTRTNAKLEVSFVSLFGWRPFWGDYWILALGPDYRFAIVGTPDRRYGWVLSRTPRLPPATRASIDARLGELGYDPARFRATPHG